MGKVLFKVVETQDEMLKSYSVRSIVFIEEQNCSYDIEVDGLDFSALHILGEIDGEPVAAGRIRFLGEMAKFERLAIRKSFRGKGFGDQLLQFMMKTVKDLGYSKIKLHAQTQALDFYIKNGFEPKGDKFYEADIEHLLMVYTAS